MNTQINQILTNTNIKLYEIITSAQLNEAEKTDISINILRKIEDIIKLITKKNTLEDKCIVFTVKNYCFLCESIERANNKIKIANEIFEFCYRYKYFLSSHPKFKNEIKSRLIVFSRVSEYNKQAKYYYKLLFNVDLVI